MRLTSSIAHWPVAIAMLAAAAQAMAQDARTSPALVISVQPSLFAAGATLEVQVWNAAQIAALTDNARCASSHDTRTGTDQFSCPDGITYRPVTPERIRAPLGSGNEIDVSLTSVKTGEEFRVAVSGPSRDGCNTTSATAVRTADSGKMTLREFAWQTTARACVKGDSR